MSPAPASVPRLSDYTADLSQHQKSVAFVRFLSILHNQDWPVLPLHAAKIYANRWPLDPHRDIIEKAAVTPGTTFDVDWSPIAAVKPLADAFVAYAYAAAIIGKMPLRTVPFNSSLPAQTTPGVYGWAGQAKPKALTKFDFATVTVRIAKATGDIVVTDELMRLAAPGTKVLLRDALAAGVAAFVDRQFTDPTVAAVANVHPASITNGVTPIAPTGTTGAALVADVGALMAQFFTANPNVMTATLIMTPAIAAMLAGATKSPTLTMAGGSYSGVTVVTSGSVGTAIVLVDASAILLATGGIELNGSRNATVEMVDTPTDPPTAATVPVSLWPQNLIALRAEWFVNWTKARTSAVSLISPTAYVPGT